MPNVVSIVTGPIVGLQSTTYLEDTVEFASKLGRNIHLFNLFDEILAREGMKADNAYEEALCIGELLDGYQYQFKAMRDKAYLALGRIIDKLPSTDNVVIRTPASVDWRGINYEFKDHRIIAEAINPDRIITLIDAEWKMMDRLQTEYGKHALQVITHQKNASIHNILCWLGSEVSRSEDWTEWVSFLSGRKVSHNVIGIMVPSQKERTEYVRDVDNMAKLLTEKDVTTFYASYSMTVADERVRNVINRTIWDLRDYGVVLDPASIEIGQNINDQDESVVFAYTVRRDLNWYVQKVDVVAAFHPYTELPPLSTGMMDEIGHARAYNKERYLVLPTGANSPFTGGNFVPVSNLFRDIESFFNYLRNGRRPRLYPRFADMTCEFLKYQEAVNSGSRN